MKKINVNRPSLWYEEGSIIYNLRLLYPDGTVEILTLNQYSWHETWRKSIFTWKNYPEKVVRDFRKAGFQFIGYI